MDNNLAGIAARRVDPAAHRVDTQRMAGGIEPHPLEFTGSGGEYFRVWIVNVLLSVVTLGLYTPFARRRSMKGSASVPVTAERGGLPDQAR